MRVGLVDLDTSHARSFAVALNQRDGVTVSAVCDAGQVRPSGLVDRFCSQFGCQRCDSPETLAGQVDAAMVLSADWEVHLARLAPLLSEGVPCYVDKPITGSVDALDRFVQLVDAAEAPVLTGSGWRFNDAIDRARQDWWQANIETVHGIVGNHFFYYGVHLAEAVLGLLGPGMESVELLNRDERAAVIRFTHQRGTRGRLLLNGDTVFRGVCFESAGVGQAVTFSSDQIHHGICEALLTMFECGEPPLTPMQQTESVRIMLAAEQSARIGGPVALTELDRATHWPSGSFMADYVAASQPASLIGAE